LPYPSGTDKVVDGDNAIQALATAIDNGILKAYAIEVNQTVNADGNVTTDFPDMGGPTLVFAQPNSAGWSPGTAMHLSTVACYSNSATFYAFDNTGQPIRNRPVQFHLFIVRRPGQ
jgi:hypothetical protein